MGKGFKEVDGVGAGVEPPHKGNQAPFHPPYGHFPGPVMPYLPNAGYGIKHIRFKSGVCGGNLLAVPAAYPSAQQVKSAIQRGEQCNVEGEPGIVQKHCQKGPNNGNYAGEYPYGPFCYKGADIPYVICPGCYVTCTVIVEELLRKGDYLLKVAAKERCLHLKAASDKVACCCPTYIKGKCCKYNHQQSKNGHCGVVSFGNHIIYKLLQQECYAYPCKGAGGGTGKREGNLPVERSE